MLPCPLYQLTGIQCPYCGSQRAVVALLGGQWMEAWQYNPFFWLSLPWLLLFVVASCRPAAMERWKAVRWAQDDRVLLAYLLVALLWALYRNLVG